MKIVSEGNPELWAPVSKRCLEVSERSSVSEHVCIHWQKQLEIFLECSFTITGVFVVRFLLTTVYRLWNEDAADGFSLTSIFSGPVLSVVLGIGHCYQSQANVLLWCGLWKEVQCGNVKSQSFFFLEFWAKLIGFSIRARAHVLTSTS